MCFLLYDLFIIFVSHTRATAIAISMKFPTHSQHRWAAFGYPCALAYFEDFVLAGSIILYTNDPPTLGFGNCYLLMIFFLIKEFGSDAFGIHFANVPVCIKMTKNLLNTYK